MGTASGVLRVGTLTEGCLRSITAYRLVVYGCGREVGRIYPEEEDVLLIYSMENMARYHGIIIPICE